ncbi:hypothetical protein F889_01423 [Acinetobacter colistiniresistens]|uniref:AB hydrolase-1 domain-containing protein n=1 Tax=Acinetobacter colistiniresistens TaxID=280145 RepID=N9QXI0_9GAMM|nr:alpha/beta fold hydrolase [Acinetobacter colistiniresistens]ENX34786.1 hypothetical protein F889_01423 [Acinetobacter colistiniresistens]
MNTPLTVETHTNQINVVRNYLAAFAENNIEKALEYIHQDAIWHIDGDPAVATVGLIQGHAAIRKWLLNFPTAFKSLDFAIDQMVNVEQDVLVIGRFRHLVLKTETIVDSDYIIKFTVAAQKIVRYQIFEDSLLLSQVHANSSVSRKIEMKGMTYSWDDMGHGAPIIFLHGLFLERSFWYPMINQLPNYRCIAFDMPGHAESGWRDRLDLDGIAEDIVLWMKEYRIKKAALVGHSQGGMIAMRIAAKYPDMVDRLLLINSSARKENEESLGLWQQREKALLSTDDSRLKLFKEIQTIKFTVERLKQSPEIAEKALARLMRYQPEHIAQALRAAIIERTDIRSMIQAIQAQTVVLSGEHDRATPSELGQEIANLIPHSVHKKLLNTSHAIPVEAANETVDILLELMN